MSYQKAYLHLFHRITDVIQLLESMDNKQETVNLLLLLKSIQVEGEEHCTGGDE
ncbi:MAG: hypothetical protein RR185_06770 [Angelakisella sp.]